LVRPKKAGAWRLLAREYSNLDPAKSAWFPADKTLVTMTALMNDPAI
jgi:hypothetical protein